MKKVLILLLIVLLTQSQIAFADSPEDAASNEMGDLMQYSDTFDNPFGGQKQITDEEFQKTLEQVKAKRAKKLKNQPKQIKGKNNNDADSNEYIKETDAKNLILSVPVVLINGDETEIPMGHYKVKSNKVGEKVYLEFYQSSTLVAKVPAIETKYDFDEKEINFVKILPYDEDRVRVIFGTMDLNAYTFIKMKK